MSRSVERAGIACLALVLVTAVAPSVRAADDARTALGQARALADDGRWRAAARVLRDATRNDPGPTAVWIELARVEAARGRHPAAVRAWRAAVARDPDGAEALGALAVALAEGGSAKKADAIFARRARLGPPLDAHGLAWWGAALEDLGRSETARERYQRALALDPTERFAQARWGALLATDPAARARGMALLADALGGGALDADTLAALGRGYASGGRADEGFGLLRRALGAARHREQRRRIESALAATAAMIPRAPAPADAPNVVVIVIDTLRADHLGCFGYARPTSPAIDALAAGGVAFAHAASQAPWTGASIASLLSGVNPSVHGLDGGIEWRGGAAGSLPFTAQRTIAVGLPMLASVLRGSGFHTAGFVSNVYVNSIFGFGHGFDVFADDHADYSADVLGRKRRGDATLAQVARWLEAKPPEPFLLFVHLNDPHWPYDPPPPFGRAWTAGYRGAIEPRDTGFVVESEGRPVDDLTAADLAYLIGLYDGEIAFADSLVADLGRRLASAALARPLVTVLASDHGEEFLEHGSTSHGYTLFEEQTHVPLIVHAPGRLAPARVDAPVELVDVLPTVLELAGLASRSPAGLQGRSLVPLMRGAAEGREATFSEAPLRGRLRAVRRADGRKLIRNDADGSVRIFDLARDPGERADRTSDVPGPERAGLEEDLRAWSARNRSARAALMAGGGAALHAPLDAATRRRLEGLGYVEPGGPPQ